ncbi:MAG TPA: ABC transporter permease, partial [Pseudobdellovibrionaceae bacterium]|nr:ABC transporter permease [Pseudobdellovibrionaceae bacterium]
GSYKLKQREVSQLTEDELAVLRRDEIGFIFQQFNLLPRISALENVAMPLLYSQKNTVSSLPLELLKKVNLSDRSTHRPNELSGGQQQRVAIARALVNLPQIIFADEPTGNLDSVSQVEIIKVLKELNQSGITVIIVTHEEDVAAHAKRIIKVRDGLIQSDQRVAPLIPPIDQKTPQVEQKQNGLNLKSSGIEILNHFKQGFQVLASNKVRTALSTLGVLIGVAAVVAMLAIGRGASEQIQKQLSSLGSNLLVLRVGALRIGGVAQESGSNTRLSTEDAIYLKNHLSMIKDISPQVNGRGQVTFQNKNWSTSILGAASSYEKMHAATPSIGRFFTDEETQSRARVAVIGVTLQKELFGQKSPIGEMIKINKVNFQVIGVLPEKGASGFRNQDDMILLPFTTAMFRLLGKLYLDSIEL